MNLPRSAVTPSTPKTSSGQEYSDYMNVEPRDIHIYQNTSILSIQASEGDANNTNISPLDGDTQRTLDNSSRNASIPKSSTSNQNSIRSPSASNNNTIPSLPNGRGTTSGTTDKSLCHTSHSQSPNQSSVQSSLPIASNDISRSHDTSDSTTEGLVNPIASTSIDTTNNSLSSGKSCRDTSHISSNSSQLSPGRRREGLADSSFVERKYGLVFSDGADCDTEQGPYKGDSRHRTKLGHV